MKCPGFSSICRRPLVLFTCALGMGIVLSRGLGPPAVPLAIALIGGVCLASRPSTFWLLLGIGLLCGVLRGKIAAPPKLQPVPAGLPRLIRLTGEVSSPPGQGENGTLLFKLRTNAGTVPVGWQDNGNRVIGRGTKIRLTGLALSMPPARENDAPPWKVKTRGANLVVIGTPPFWYPPAILDKCRLTLRLRLLHGIRDPDALALSLCLLLGDDSLLNPWHQLRFRHTGIGHLLVVSGLHIALLAGVVLLLLKGRGKPIAAGLVFLYALLAGGRPPALRAAMVYTIWSLAPRFHRRRDLPTALAGAALPVLILAPQRLSGASFQISYGAVIAMFLLGPGLAKAFASFSLPGRLAWIAGYSTAATLGTAPLVLYHFGAFSPWSILFTPLITPLLAIQVILSGIAPWLPSFAGPPLGFLYRLQVTLLEAADALPATPVFPLTWPSTALLATTIGIALFLLFIPHTVIRACAFILPCLPHFFSPTSSPVTGKGFLLNAGHGQCLVIQLPQSGTLVHDAGSLWKKHRLAWDFKSAMQKLGNRRINTLCISHADQDHISALPLLLAWFPVTRIYMPDHASTLNLSRRLNSHGCKVNIFPQGKSQQIHPGITLLTPGRKGKNKNDGCLVLHLQTAGLSILSPGDLSGPGLLHLITMARQGHLQARTMIAPHHGAHTGVDAQLARVVGAKTIYVSRSWRAGPTPALRQYQVAGAEVIWTAISGEIEIK